MAWPSAEWNIQLTQVCVRTTHFSVIVFAEMIPRLFDERPCSNISFMIDYMVDFSLYSSPYPWLCFIILTVAVVVLMLMIALEEAWLLFEVSNKLVV